MSAIKMIKDDDCLVIGPTEEEDEDSKAKRIIAILTSQSRRAECGSVVKIPVGELLEPESVERMSEEYVYSIISIADEMCEETGSKFYQINWAFQHLPIGNTYLSLIAPVFEHNFQVVYFPDEEDSKKDKYFTDQFGKKKGEWTIVEYGGEKCEF